MSVASDSQVVAPVMTPFIRSNTNSNSTDGTVTVNHAEGVKSLRSALGPNVSDGQIVASIPIQLFRLGLQHAMISVGTSQATGSGITTYYKKRARDSGNASPVYVTWVTTILAQPYPYTPPYGGPLVDTVIAEWWQV